MALERITVPLPAGFDPSRHVPALPKVLSKLGKGEGWTVETFSMDDKTFTATRQTTVAEVKGRDEKKNGALEVNLPIGTKPADGDKFAAKMADAYPGYHLVKFEPFVGKATLATLTENELRARGAVAVALSVKPWEVLVQARKDGGFSFQLPAGYVPSKHDTKLQEVAETAVGRFGWYFTVDPKTLVAQIIPSDPPTFPAAVPFPFDAVRPVKAFDKTGDEERFTLALALGLGQPGEKNVPVPMSLDGSNSVLIVGLPGAGKQSRFDSLHPVPVSKRFPTGWARNDELEVGDLLYAPDGSVTRIIGFSDWHEAPNYRVTFSDGQAVDVAGTHLWKASSVVSRTMHRPTQLARKNARRQKVDLVAEKASQLRSLAAEIGAGTVGTLTDIARLSGYSDTSLYQKSDWFTHLGTRAFVPDPKSKAWSYCMDDLVQYWCGKGMGRARGTYHGHQLTPDDLDSLRGLWLSGRELVKHLVARGANPSLLEGKKYTRLFSVAATAKARKERTHALREVTLYPVDEVLFTLADHYESNAPGRLPIERIVTTAEMAEHLNYSADKRSNWAVRLTDPIDGPDLDLPVDPYVLGVWLGDGSATSGNITSADIETIDEIVTSGYSLRRVETKCESNSARTYFFDQLNPDLHRLYGVKHSEKMPKRIPPIYLRASKAQRLSLLQGLMDTDGSIDASGSCEFGQGEDHADLMTDAIELMRSLGLKVVAPTLTKTNYVRTGGDRDGETAMRLRTTFTTTLDVFRMKRKRAQLPTEVRDTQNWLYVTNIEVSESARMRCVKVDHPEHLYLIEGFIPTHNSVAVQSVVYQALVKGFRLAVINASAKATDYSWVKPYVQDHWWGSSDEGTSVAEALTVASLVDEEGNRLGELLNKHGVGKWQELPEAVKKANPPILVVADELAALLNKPTVPAGLTKEAKQLPQFVQMAQDYLESKLLTNKLNRLVAVHRAAGIRELYLSQRPSQTEGFPPSLKNLIPHRVLLGPSPSDSDIKMAFRDERRITRIPPNVAADEVASRGAGIAHLDGTDPVVMKGFYASTADFEKHLVRLFGPGNPSDARVRPTAAQIEKHVPRADGEAGLEDDPPPAPIRAGEKMPSGRPASELDPKFGPVRSFDADGNVLKGAAAAAAGSKKVKDSAPTGGPACPDCGEPIQANGDCGC